MSRPVRCYCESFCKDTLFGHSDMIVGPQYPSNQNQTMIILDVITVASPTSLGYCLLKPHLPGHQRLERLMPACLHLRYRVPAIMVRNFVAGLIIYCTSSVEYLLLMHCYKTATLQHLTTTKYCCYALSADIIRIVCYHTTVCFYLLLESV